MQKTETGVDKTPDLLMHARPSPLLTVLRDAIRPTHKTWIRPPVLQQVFLVLLDLFDHVVAYVSCTVLFQRVAAWFRFSLVCSRYVLLRSSTCRIVSLSLTGPLSLFHNQIQQWVKATSSYCVLRWADLLLVNHSICLSARISLMCLRLALTYPLPLLV